MNPDYKLIDYRLFDPRRPSLFKTKANERAEFRRLFCCGSDRCQLFAIGSCTMWRLFGPPCPYGKFQFESGPTKRSVKISEWVGTRKEMVKGMSQLDSAGTKMYEIGDYIFFPYPHWTLADNVSLEKNERATLIGGGIEYIPRERFTIDFFQKIVVGRPRALFGGEITSYQRDVIPSIVLHLSESFPEIFVEWEAKYPDTASRFAVKNYIGRSAIITTLPVGTVIPHKDGEMVWNGEVLIVSNYESVFLPVDAETAQLTITPKPGANIKITRNEQVGPDTKFID